MANDLHDPQGEKLAGLLAALKKDVSFPDNFEDKFLQEFHRKQSATQVRPVSLVNRIKRFFSNKTNVFWIYRTVGATTVLAISVIILTDVNPLSSLNSTASSSSEKSDFQPVSHTADGSVKATEFAPQQDQQAER